MAREFIDIGEFRDEGYLQEVNRQFFHPLGLALAIDWDKEEEEWYIAGIFDDRDDPEGVFYENGVDLDKKIHVRDLWAEKAVARFDELGYVIQP